MTEGPAPVYHNEAASQFEVSQDGLLARLIYDQQADRIVFISTKVPPELEGQGIGSALARAGLDYARAKGLGVVPRCPFVRAYITRHSEYQPLVVE